jgi:cell wall-associated NlpC family hydrolase
MLFLDSPTQSFALSREIDWIVGAPYVHQGRGPDGFDCLGAVLWIYREAWGVVLPDPARSDSPVEAIRQFLARFRTLTKVGDLRSGDLIHAYRSRPQTGQHLAIAESRDWAVEADIECGVRRLRPEEVVGTRVLYKRLRTK